jgi:DNA-binding transcriptional LysR family regulator
MVMRTASVFTRAHVLHLTAAGAKLLDRARPVIAESEKALAEKLGLNAYHGLLQTCRSFCRTDSFLSAIFAAAILAAHDFSDRLSGHEGTRRGSCHHAFIAY